MKVQDLLAKIGGMINALLIIIKILSFNYQRFLYLMNLVDLTIKEEKKVKVNKDDDSMNQLNHPKLNNYIAQQKKEDKESDKAIIPEKNKIVL